MALWSHPTWATGGAVGIYSWSLPVVIAGSLVSTLGITTVAPYFNKTLRNIDFHLSCITS